MKLEKQRLCYIKLSYELITSKMLIVRKIIDKINTVLSFGLFRCSRQYLFQEFHSQIYEFKNGEYAFIVITQLTNS